MSDPKVDAGGFRDIGTGTLVQVLGVASFLSTFAATIPNGASVSNKLDMLGMRAACIIMPAAWTAASLTFLVSHDGITYSSLYDDTDTEVAISTAQIVAGRARALTLTLFLPYRYLQLRSGITGAAANQGADRVFQVIAG